MFGNIPGPEPVGKCGKMLAPTLRQNVGTNSAGHENSKSLNALLSMVRSDTDESKIAGLMLIPRVVEAHDEKAMLEIFNAVGFSFLLRLLTSPGSPGNSSDESCMYKVLALNLLSTFCVIPSVESVIQTDASFVMVCQEILTCLQNKILRNSSLDDIITVMISLASFSPGRATLNQEEAATRICETIADESIPFEKAEKLLHIYDLIIDLDLFPSHATKILPPMANTFCKCKTKLKFEVFARLVGVLSSENECVQNELRCSTDRSWHCSVRDALMELLRNRVRGEHRRNIFLCALCMFDTFGPDWAMIPSPADALEMHGKFVQLLLAFINIELRMRLEGPSSLRPADNVVLVPVCIALLEHAIKALTDEADVPNAWATLAPDAVLFLRKQLEESADGHAPVVPCLIRVGYLPVPL